MTAWNVEFKGRLIRVENGISRNRLFVDGELQDEYFGFGFRSRLYGAIREVDGIRKPIRVALGGHFRVHCRIFVDDRIVFHSSPDRIASEAIERSHSSID